jgi:hypothetical protein
MDYQMISADDHLDLQYLPTNLWTERLPKALRDCAPHIEEREAALSGSATVRSGGAGPAHAARRVQKRSSMRSIGAAWTRPSADRHRRHCASRTWTGMA